MLNRIRGVIGFLVLLLALGSIACGKRARAKGQTGPPGATARAGTLDEVTLRHAGAERRYFVHLPTGYTASKKVPVVLVFHGGGGNAETQPRQTGFNNKADREGFIVVYPDGTGRPGWGKRHTWNAGRCCGWAAKNQVDDIGFVKKVLDDIEKRYAVDTKRIYATGHSNGAAFTYRVGCQLADRIAAIAPNSGHDSYDECKPSRPLSVLHFHGTADEEVGFEGGKCGGTLPGAKGWKCRSVPDYAEAWCGMNGCSHETKVVYERGEAKCVSHGECKNGAEVILCTVGGGGHTWPGGDYVTDKRFVQRMVGKISRDIHATDMMWQFFERHPMP